MLVVSQVTDSASVVYELILTGKEKLTKKNVFAIQCGAKITSAHFKSQVMTQQGDEVVLLVTMLCWNCGTF